MNIAILVLFVICDLVIDILSGFPSLAFAQPKEMTIDANKISYEKTKNLINAEGSVEVIYKDILMTGNKLVYNTSEESINATSGFVLDYEGITLEGDSLYFEVKNRKGKGEKININYKGLILSGGRVIFDPEKYELKNAEFTTCNLLQPHYRVTAADLQLFPKHQWMVAYWGIFWFAGLPVVPMPTYIYDFSDSDEQKKNLPPFPQVGSNSEDGNYLNESLAWHLRRELSGTYSIIYAANKGLGGGLTANYIANENNRGNFRINGNPVNGLYGGLTHRFSFGGYESPEEKNYFGLFTPVQHARNELEATLSLKERINYQRVSYSPFLKLRSQLGEEIVGGLKLNYELFAGVVAEEGNTRLAEGGGTLDFFKDLPETKLGQITPRLTLDSAYYSNGAKWQKPSVGLDVAKKITPDYGLKISYQHYLAAEGGSPFNFENYRFRIADRLKPDLVYKIGETKGRISASYFLDNWSPEEIDYSLFFLLHCYNLEVTYRSLRNEFTLGFSLTAR